MEVKSLICTPRLPPSNKKEAHGVVRPLADYHPTVWGEFFIHSLAPADQLEDQARMRQRVERLMVEVRTMFAKNARDCDQLAREMDFVDALQRLALAYHFGKEISAALARFHDSQVLLESEDLHVVSLRFRLLREQGYNINPSDVFNKFRDADGRFRSSLGSDAKGLLSFYEAAHLGTPAEVVLEEAIIFCRGQLESVLGHLQPPLAAEVARALETPLVRRIKRLETRQYLSFYEAMTEGRNDLVLELAKLDFNLLQSLHQEEIRNLTRWWKGLGLTERLTFARDRLVEGYFWTMGVHYEAQFARSRLMMAKVVALVSVLDDIYDSYGTLEELQLLTDVIERWDIGDVNRLPDYMDVYFALLTCTVKQFEDELEDEQKSYRTQYLKGEFQKLAKAYLKEAEWHNEGYIPTLEDHLHVSQISTGITTLICASILGMGDIATKEVFDWVASYPKIVEASCIVGRILDDIVSNEFEQKREHVASTVQCYMKEYGVLKGMACQKLREKADIAWKVINEEWIQHAHIPLQLLVIPFNLGSTMEIYYKHGDGYTHYSEATKDIISLLLVDYVAI